MDDQKEDSKDDATIANKIIELVTEFPQGVSDKVLIANMPTVDPKARAMVINKLLMAEKIDLFNGKDGLLYRKREPSRAGSIAGDQEEKVVFKIIEGAGNIGVWIRDIRAKSNLGQTQLNKVLKSLETKNLIKSVKSVNASKKKVSFINNINIWSFQWSNTAGLYAVQPAARSECHWRCLVFRERF